MIVLRNLGIVLVAAVSVTAHAQQRNIRVVSLLSQDKAMVDSTSVASKDITAHFLAEHTGQAARPIIMIRNCEGVSADDIQAVAKELQKHNFIVALDTRGPEVGLCAR